MVDKFLTKMYRTSDFVFTVTRDFVHNCQTPVLTRASDDLKGNLRGRKKVGPG